VDNLLTLLTIGELARRVGMRTSALRYYESVGLLPAPQRVSGQRRYDPSTVQLIAVLQTAGFTIAEMQTLVNGFAPGTPPAERWQRLAQTKLTEIDALIQRAEQMKRILHNALHCGCLELSDCVVADETGMCQR
jgi:MerR family transcriptional regulator, redox-sensitive transcriptional activator SoxR